jgi:thiol:disulfide interchange protein DsbC
MSRWLSLALVFTLGAISGWTAIAIGGTKPEEKAANAAAAPAATPSEKTIAKGGPELEALRDKITKKLPEIQRENINPSPIPGVYEIQRGHLFGYITADGRYLIQGDLVDVNTGEEITEDHRRADRLNAIKALGDQYIEFAPKPPIETKYTVTVFTDVDCGYCRKLHSEIAGYNAQGIAVHYVFFPRTGPNTPSFYKAEQVWCSDDRKDALTRAKKGEQLNAARNCPNPVQKEYDLGVDIGVRGTPALILPNGDLFPGYVPPQQLAAMLAAPSSSLASKQDPGAVDAVP